MQNQHQPSDTGVATDAMRAPFGRLVRCLQCKTSRPMQIKSLRPGLVSDLDRITYRCAVCGAEKEETAT